MLGVMVRDLQRSNEGRVRGRLLRCLQNSMQGPGLWRRTSISTTAAMLSLLCADPAIVPRAYAEERSAATQLTTVSVPPGSLEEGLIALGRQANLKLVYPSALTAGKKTAGVAGRMTAKDAVKQMLARTGLGFFVTPTGAVHIAPLSPHDNALRADASIPLDTIDVQGGGAQDQQAHPYGYGPGSGDRTSNPQQAIEASKTGTKLADIPANVQTVPHELLSEQGATMLSQSLYDVSGANVGGQDAKGIYDTFLIEGLNSRVYEDGFSDGDELGGISHSLNGVNRIEVVEGPGSALFGSGPPGGTINIDHYKPSSDLHYGASVQAGSFGTIVNNDYVTGPTNIPGLTYRIDGTFSRDDGFRDLSSHDYEVRPSLEYHWGDHTTDLALDVRQINETPDSYGIIYFHGSPFKDVSINGKYSTPFAFSNEFYIRPTLTDQWIVNSFLTINNRLSYVHRTVDSLENGDSSNTQVSGIEVIGRQLRQQTDNLGDFDYQFEPLWRFSTGPAFHSLLTGFEYVNQNLDTQRSTADLPNIPDVFNPVPPETSLLGLKFLCDAKHSCDDDLLRANYESLYATNQIALGQLQVRAGVRQDWFNTSLTPQITVPGAFGTNGEPLLAGVTDTRNDAPVSWNVGALYKLFPWMSPYAGVSRSYLANFNSENTQDGIGAPETALQYEAGIKFSFLSDRLVLNTSAFDVSRNNVAATETINGVESVIFDSQRTKGVQAAVDAKLTDQWHILANVTFQDAVITDNPQGIQSVGNHPQGVPAEIANLWTTYLFSIAGVSGFHVGAGLNYQGKSYSDITNVNSIPPYLIANAAFGYDAKNWGIDINVHNLTNERYFIAANAAGAFVGQPLSATVILHASF
jgi:iron complex outermembrane receptor protein